jgi:hypothetical protein
MKTTARATAAAIYALLGLLAFGVLAILLTPPPLPSWSLIMSTPGAALTMGSLLSLGIVSAALAAVLWRGVQLPTLVLGILALSLPVLAIGWNLIAPLFWFAPLFFVWRAVAAS